MAQNYYVRRRSHDSDAVVRLNERRSGMNLGEIKQTRSDCIGGVTLGMLGDRNTKATSGK